jgi:hypothetical protein
MSNNWSFLNIARYLNPLAYIAAILALGLYCLPFVILGPNSYIRIHDNLDGEFVYKYLLAISGHAFDYGNDVTIPNVLNGIHRFSLSTGFDVTAWFFFMFKPYVAYIVNYIIIHLTGFLGMFLLLKEHFIKSLQSRYIVVLAALCFALIPFYSQYGLSVAGQPLLLYAFLNILQHNQKPTDYLIIILFPLYSSLVLVGPFIVVFLLILLALDFFRNKKLNRRFLFAIFFLSMSYCLIKLSLINSMFINKPFISQRTVFNIYNDFNILSNIKRTFDIFFHTHYHTGTFPTFLVLISTFISSIIAFRRKSLNNELLFIILSIFFICTLYGFYDWIVYSIGGFIKAFIYFNANRFTFLLPLLFMLLFAISLKQIEGMQFSKQLIWCLGVFQIILVLYSNTEYKNNVKLLCGKGIKEPTYNQFFDANLFSRIDKYINRPKETFRVVSIGMYPSIAQFNGFYTADGYANIYDLSYKQKFRKVIETELNKNEELRNYFDNWGNRCYVFTHELGKNYLYGKHSHRTIDNLQLKTMNLKELGVEYILSSVKINNYKDNNLTYEAVFSDAKSFWEIYLYKMGNKETSNFIY